MMKHTFIIEHKLASLAEDRGADNVDLHHVGLGQEGVLLPFVPTTHGFVRRPFLLDDGVPETRLDVST